ncbi:ATP-binding protein [Streptomyces sp. NPDC087850]|uniref:ATP-binding protein n=1 Tax=Streptomyces sp. NPDC087850 TaxID=3365809 RepID=UPI0038294C10
MTGFNHLRASADPMRWTQCPPPPPDIDDPCPGNLAYGLTLPSALVSPAIARETAELVLDAHGFGDLSGAALRVVHELAVYACHFTPGGQDVHLTLCYRDHGLRIAVYDTHRPHTHPRLAEACTNRRHAQLRDLLRLAETHEGAWGIETIDYPGAATRTWFTLAHTPDEAV